VEYKVFCLLIFVIQLTISALNFWIAREHRISGNTNPVIADILCGISWFATGCYWLYNAIAAPM
jgi:hypothetical protein